MNGKKKKYFFISIRLHINTERIILFATSRKKHEAVVSIIIIQTVYNTVV